jgi:hypothetical protein
VTYAQTPPTSDRPPCTLYASSEVDGVPRYVRGAKGASYWITLTAPVGHRFCSGTALIRAGVDVPRDAFILRRLKIRILRG